MQDARTPWGRWIFYDLTQFKLARFLTTIDEPAWKKRTVIYVDQIEHHRLACLLVGCEDIGPPFIELHYIIWVITYRKLRPCDTGPRKIAQTCEQRYEWPAKSCESADKCGCCGECNLRSKHAKSLSVSERYDHDLNSASQEMTSTATCQDFIRTVTIYSVIMICFHLYCRGYTRCNPHT